MVQVFGLVRKVGKEGGGGSFKKINSKTNNKKK